MTGVARVAMLDLRTVAPYRIQGLVLFGLLVLMGARTPAVLVPALALLVTSQFAAYPFNVADKAGLETLYAVLPVPRRSVLYGHYAWALACFVATTAVGTALALLMARIQALPFSGGTVATVLAVSWALFAVNIAIQFPLLIRFGFSQINVLATILPLALAGVAFVRLHLTVTWIQNWLPLLWVAGVAAVVASAATATSLDRRHVR
jgi:hypothetical protein